MFLKELSKIWATFKLGEYGPSSYLLVDNSPHKALEYHIIVCFILLGLKHSATSTSLFFMFLTIQVVVQMAFKSQLRQFFLERQMSMSYCLSTILQWPSSNYYMHVPIQPNTCIFPQTYTRHEYDEFFLDMRSC